MTFMNTNITEIKGTDLINVCLNERLAGCLGRAAQLAVRLFDNEDVREDVASFDPDLLRFLRSGAARLVLLAGTEQSPGLFDTTFLVDGHTTACLVASRVILTAAEKEDILEVLGFFAGVSPCRVLAECLPPWEDFQRDRESKGRGREIYEALRRRPASDAGFRRIKLQDALVLRLDLQLKTHPVVMRLGKDLDQITATHRHALGRLMARTS